MIRFFTRKQPKALEPLQAATMRVYSDSMWGRGTLFVTPGVDDPHQEAWNRTTIAEDGTAVRQPIQFAVKFTDGAATVDSRLGEYLIRNNMANRYAPLFRPPPPAAERPVEGPKYATPIPVGRPLNPDGSFSPVD